MKKIKITQVKSAIDRPNRQKLTLLALGLKKMNSSRDVEATDQILGMVRTVNHLLKVEEVQGNDSEPVAVEASGRIERGSSPAEISSQNVSFIESLQQEPAPEVTIPESDLGEGNFKNSADTEA
jgi:large subunit ribosomal protein L30